MGRPSPTSGLFNALASSHCTDVPPFNSVHPSPFLLGLSRLLISSDDRSMIESFDSSSDALTVSTTGYSHNSPPPRYEPIISENLSTTAPSDRIAYAPITLSILSKYHSSRCHRVMGATESGKTTVSKLFGENDQNPCAARGNRRETRRFRGSL